MLTLHRQGFEHMRSAAEGGANGTRFEIAQLGQEDARWTRASTNASCQQEKAENWYGKAWGPASTSEVDRATPRCRFSNERGRP